MADIIVDSEFRRKQKDGSYKIYHPVTKAKNVKCSNGKDVESQLAETMSDSKRLTKDKTITGAINELFQFASNGKKNWVDVIGTPLATTDTFDVLRSKTQTLKNILANNLMAKGQQASGGENLTNLISKIFSINTGIKSAKGLFYYSESDIKYIGIDYYCSLEIPVNLDFTPKLLYVISQDYNNANFILFTSGSLVSQYGRDLWVDNGSYSTEVKTNLVDGKYFFAPSNTKLIVPFYKRGRNSLSKLRWYAFELGGVV